MMARREAEAFKRDPKIFMNQELLRVFDNRTLESIKGQRRKADYKEMVKQFLAELETSSSSQEDSDNYQSADEVRNSLTEPRSKLEEFLVNAEPLNIDEYNGRRVDTICEMVTWRPKDEVALELALYLKETFAHERRATQQNRVRVTREPRPLSRKVKRREEYARVQDLWKKDRCECARRILKDELTQQQGLTKEEMEPFWRTVFTTEKTSVLSIDAADDTMISLWDPVKPLEVKCAFPPLRTAKGPDGLTTRQVKCVPLKLLARIFSLIMWTEAAPEHLLRSRTVLIPKKKEASEPGEFRPITVSSVLLRTFHKILANRLKGVKLDERQRAFIWPKRLTQCRFKL